MRIRKKERERERERNEKKENVSENKRKEAVLKGEKQVAPRDELTNEKGEGRKNPKRQ
jgi:hypothetical protein